MHEIITEKRRKKKKPLARGYYGWVGYPFDASDGGGCDISESAAPYPLPFRVEYPYGLPGDGFRDLAGTEKMTCVAYYRGIDPALIQNVPRGNRLRYDVSDPKLGDESLERKMRLHGYQGGDGQRILIYVEHDGTSKIAEGNHRLEAALKAGVKVEVQIHYRGGSDVSHPIWPVDTSAAKFVDY